jgi:membrane protease YdiL (CAAX protease family)
MFTFLHQPILCVLLLYLTVILLWYSKPLPGTAIPLWFVSVMFAIIIGFINGQLTFSAIILIIFSFALTYYLGNKHPAKLYQRMLSVLLFLLGIGLRTHIFSGFHNIPVLKQVVITKDAIPFTMYWNIDSILLGIFILGCMVPLIKNLSKATLALKQTVLPAFLTIVVVMIIALALKFVQFTPKLPSFTWVWLTNNLLFVCMAEEAFFRGFVQQYLSNWLNNINGGHWIAIAIAAIFFGLSHYSGWSIKYMTLATIAGVGYGWIYWRTKSIEASILTHFTLNLIHFLFFTYPALMTGFK